MTANILACLCCCWLIGRAAIWNSNKCQKAKRERDLETAKRYSEHAKMLLIATIVVGIICDGIVFGIVIIFIVT